MRPALVLVLLFGLGASPSFGETDPVRAWLDTLSALQTTSAPLAVRQDRLLAVRRQLQDWLALNPTVAVTVPAPPPLPWSEDQYQAQFSEIAGAIEAIRRTDPSQPFRLGTVTVDVTAPLTRLSPVTNSLDRLEMQRHRALTVNQAIEYLPGVAVDHRAPRNQTGISIGGFDSRQVPLYVDGIPAYFPFDGYVDLSRYLTSDVAVVQVARGYSSPLVGPNALGGVVNVVTRQPERRIEGEVFAGTAAGNEFDGGVHVGSRGRRFFVQTSADRLQSDSYPIAQSFRFNALQRDGQRVNADRRDERYWLRAGWTPRAQDQYVVSASIQRGRTGVPPYAGTAPPCPAGGAPAATPCVTPKFWRWPYWDSDTYYFNSNTSLGAAAAVQVRAFYARYANRLDMFDDAKYASMNLSASSGTGRNDDHSIGASGEFTTLAVPRHTLGASFFVKTDTHTEQTTTFSRLNVPSTTPVQTSRDRQASYGVHDAIVVTDRLHATLGFSADQLDGLEAQDLSADKTTVVPFRVAGICGAAGGAFSACTDHIWTFNPVGSLTYGSEKAGALFLTFARKSRFPTLRDRYSYKAGRAVPNPALDAERAGTWTAGFSRTVGARSVAQVEVFRSDVRGEIENIFFLSPLCAAGGRGGAGSCQQAVNTGSELHYGVNLVLRTTPASGLTVDANYGFLRREISGAPGVFPTGTPEHKLVATATARLPRRATGIVSLRALRGIVAMSDNGLPLPDKGFASVDLGAALPLRRRLSVQGGVTNVLDANYAYWEGFPEPGRNGYVTLRYTF